MKPGSLATTSAVIRKRPDGAIEAMVGGTYHEVQPPVKLVFSLALGSSRPRPIRDARHRGVS